jgi:hypothetical protein
LTLLFFLSMDWTLTHNLIVGSSLHYIQFGFKKTSSVQKFLAMLMNEYITYSFLHGCFLAVFRKFSVMISWCLVWNHSNLWTKSSTILFSRLVMVKKVWRLHNTRENMVFSQWSFLENTCFVTS